MLKPWECLLEVGGPDRPAYVRRRMAHGFTLAARAHAALPHNAKTRAGVARDATMMP
ncbi:hypothetical protein XAPC_2604 [Xanthomonas citri pv. punicae str. LMG 859]|nr:hypothetical protein XAPC_2604 [Xanthomonas citri pv. punicae str. LMG 859]